jgi:hypothetical protein
MPVVKWIQESQREDGVTPYMSSWKNSRSAQTGKDTEIDIVKAALVTIKACLKDAVVSSTTDLYLKDSTKYAYGKMFSDGVTRLKNHVDEYLKSGTTGTRLFVATQNVNGALASSPPTSQTTLDLSTSTLKGVNTLIVHPNLTNPFTVSGVEKRLSDWGRHTTVLHELTHSLLRTKDVWKKGGVYGISPPDPSYAVTTETECRDLAGAGDASSGIPLSWFNAENWTRAIASCHASRSGSNMFL